MQLHNTTKHCFLLLVSLLAFAGCSKEKIYRPGIPQGTRFPVVTFNGFALDSVQVRVGPRSNTAGYLFEEVSGQAFKIPFDSAQAVSRIVLYQKDGVTPYTGSQFRFEDKYKDTTVNVLFDGKTVTYNPVFPKPSAGKMNLRINFKSIVTNYRGPVDIELHEMKYIVKDTVITDPVTHVKDTTEIVKKVPKTAIAFVIKNVKRTEFSDYAELPAPEDGYTEYAFYIYMANTHTGLNYPANAYREYYFDSFEFKPDGVSLITIVDNKLALETPNRIVYTVNDRAQYFPQPF